MDLETVLAATAPVQGNNIEVWFALGAAVFGGAGLKVIESLLNKGKASNDAAKEIREELRGELSGLRAEMRAVEAEVDKQRAEVDRWREKYYTLLERFHELRVLLRAHGIEIKDIDGDSETTSPNAP